MSLKDESSSLYYWKNIVLYSLGNSILDLDSILSLYLQVFLMLSWGTVVYYDGDKGHIVNRGLIPNGIAISPNKQ